MEDLQNLLNEKGDTLTLVLGYGDSSDGTGESLYDECCHRFDGRLIDVSHGGRFYGSMVHPVRFKQLAQIGNTLWGHIPETTDIVGLVESDLIWDSYDIYNLISHLNLSNLPVIITPMVHLQDGRFYDIWAFRKNGTNFRNSKPFHPDIDERRYYELDSAGSVLFMKAGLARQLTWPEEDVVVGFCRQARELGAKIILDSLTEVYHP